MLGRLGRVWQAGEKYVTQSEKGGEEGRDACTAHKPFANVRTMNDIAKYVGLAVLLVGMVVLGRSAYEERDKKATSAMLQGVGVAAMAVAASVLVMQKTEGDTIAMRTRSRT